MTATMPTGNEGEHFSWGDLIVKSGTAAAILGLIVTSLKTLEKYIPTIIARKMKSDVLAGMNELSPPYREMELAIARDGAHRALMFAAHNSGAVPSCTSPFYTSVIHVAADTYEHRQRAAGYQNIKVDSHYIKMLLQMERVGHFHYRVGDHPGEMLEDFYEAEGVTDSLLCYLGIWSNKLIYCSFAKFGGHFTKTELTWLKNRASTIKKIMEDFK